MKLKHLFLIAFASLILFTDCGKDTVDIEYNYYPKEEFQALSQQLNLPAYPLDYTVNFPKYYGRTATTFNNDLATLGRVLFYDENLSEDRSVSCASCHKQQLAFADDLALSEGVQQRSTARNSLALGSVFSFREYYGSSSSGRVPFFWDNRASTVQEQSKQTLANDLEMNMTMPEVVQRVKEEDYYIPLFRTAFGNPDVSEDRVLDAISEFVNSMASVDTRYDRELDKYYESNRFNFTSHVNADFSGLSSIENKGKQLFQTHCASCHGAVNGLPGRISANNGLDVVYDDPGMGDITGNNDVGLFKVPTLRNITLTAPYMHDGRFATLDEVLDHYSSGIKEHENLSPQLRVNQSTNGAAVKLNFSAADKAALLAFFDTFVDEEYLTTEKYSDPFK